MSVDNERMRNYNYHNNYTKTTNYQSVSKTSNVATKPAIIENKTNNILWKVGDKLNHTNYGFGIVLSVKGELIEVAFKDNKIGVKTMLGKHAALTKI
jgi:hypothetical protein